jgi:hypothetical protein
MKMLNLKPTKKKYASKDMKNMKFCLPTDKLHFKKDELNKFGHGLQEEEG